MQPIGIDGRRSECEGKREGVGAHGGGIVLPLLSFNLGVEAGQLGVAAVVLPILAYVFRDEKVRRRTVPVASSVIAAAGLYWLIERTLLG